MKAVTLLVLCFLCGFALGQFEGTWTESKRSFGGNLFLCVDQATNIVHGSYSGAGLVSGVVRGNTLIGQWYEAGYSSPHGPFTLTMAANGNSFSGSWSYSNPRSNTTDGTFSWTGNRVGRASPSRLQCLSPSNGGNTAAGKYEGGQAICVKDQVRDQNTGMSAIFARFRGFGTVEGYSYDIGRSTLLSSFAIPADASTDAYRPENNAAVFGPCTGCNTVVPFEQINTARIVIGVSIDDSQYCGHFWEGLYNTLLNAEPICFDRESFLEPRDGACGVGRVQVASAGRLIGAQEGNTAALLVEVQRAFDALNIPALNLVQGNIEDDDDDGQI